MGTHTSACQFLPHVMKKKQLSMQETTLRITQKVDQHQGKQYLLPQETRLVLGNVCRCEVQEEKGEEE